MSIPKPVPGGVLEARFLRAIEAWCAGNGMSAGAFGETVYRDRGFVASLRDGRESAAQDGGPGARRHGRAAGRPRLPQGGGGVSRGDGGQALAARTEATGNPSSVFQLLGGVSPKLATVEAVRVSMKSHASPAEWREIRARAGAMPAILTGAPLPSPEPPARPEDRDPGPEPPARGHEDRGYVDTREAAERLGLAPSTLARYRITGAGPRYYRFGGCVRYRGDHLEAWTAGRRGRRNGGVRAGDEAARRTSP